MQANLLDVLQKVVPHEAVLAVRVVARKTDVLIKREGNDMLKIELS